MSTTTSQNILRGIIRIKWLKTPSKALYLVVEGGFDEFKYVISQQEQIFNLPLRGECWYINSTIIKNFFSLIKHYLNGSIGLRGLYVWAIAKTLEVKLILSFIDNNNWDKGFKQYCNIPIILIQNGGRSVCELEGKNILCYLAMNNLPKEIFARYNLEIDKYRVVGSLRSQIYLNYFSKNRINTDNDYKILFISQYREKECYAGEVEMGLNGNKAQIIICNWLGKYVRNHAVKLHVALVSRPGSASGAEIREKQFFNKALDCQCVFHSKIADNWSSYHAISMCDMVVGLGSTMLMEAIFLSKKALFCYAAANDELNKLYSESHVPGEFEVLDCYPNYKAFKEKVDALMTSEQINNSDLNTISMIREEIKKFVR